MKGTVVILGATLIAGVIASTESPTPAKSVKSEPVAAAELQSSLDSPANETKLLINSASPTMTPTVNGDLERIPPN
jgi:hypothetical protein